MADKDIGAIVKHDKNTKVRTAVSSAELQPDWNERRYIECKVEGMSTAYIITYAVVCHVIAAGMLYHSLTADGKKLYLYSVVLA